MMKTKRVMDRYIFRSALLAGTMIIIVLFFRFVPAEPLNPDQFRLRDTKTDPVFLLSPKGWVDSVLNTLTLEDRIAQMIMVAAYSNDNRKNEEEVLKLVRDNHIGGLVFFQGYPHRQAQLTNLYQSTASTPLLIAMDAEWGLAMRLDSTIRYPKQMMLGAIVDDRLVFDMGGQIARQMKRLGVHINFAPVIDVNNNPGNPVINIRSFGENKTNVTRKALFYMIGLENNGVMAVAKHFPGHGDTYVDSHEELPVINHSMERLDSLELYPYKELIYNGLSGIMTAHLQVPAIDANTVMPASLSPLIVDSLLRQSLDFKGLIFTDALGMRGITNHYKPVEAAEMALLAGNDILLMPGEVPEVIRSISKMVKRGRISLDEIDKRCRRILAAKYWAGLNEYKPVNLQNLTNDLNKPEYRLLQRKLIESSLTVLQNKFNVLPLRNLDTLKVASVAFSTEKDTLFQEALGLYMPVKKFILRGDGTDNTDSIFNMLRQVNLVIVSVHSNNLNLINNYGISDYTIALVDSIISRHNVVLDLFANPYILERFNNLDRLSGLIVSYENAPLVQDLSAQLIFGAIGANGILPVTPGKGTAISNGIIVNSLQRLKFTIPLDAGMDEDTLHKIDDIISEAIDQQAFPGCQILVARKGKVVLNRSYGNSIYKGNDPVNITDLYDLASVTKIAATTVSMMKLADEKCLDIDQRLSAYLPYLEQTNKRDLIIRDILLHQSGLLPFMQFYYSTYEPVFKNQPLISAYLTDANPVKIGSGQYLNRYTRYKNDIISNRYSEQFPLQVADNMFITRTWADTIYNGIAKSRLTDRKEYVYSDLGFILFKQLIDTLSQVPFDRYLDSVFYRKLGAGRLCFNPLNHFSRSEIAPTEDDQLFRKQLIHGYVHDPRAAMFGGITGHAGLFGNAVDLAKLLQMLLNMGEYGGERYIDAETVELFTREPLGINGSRRGLGFDKPEPDITKPGPACLSASPSSFGHTGFTGNMVWVDPEYDMVYVFLSNRVYPDATNSKISEMNVRTNVQQILYNAIIESGKGR